MHRSRRLGGGATGFPWLPQWPGSDTKDLRCTVRCLGSQSGVTSYLLTSMVLKLPMNEIPVCLLYSAILMA